MVSSCSIMLIVSLLEFFLLFMWQEFEGVFFGLVFFLSLSL